jgi:hypothetical protein
LANFAGELQAVEIGQLKQDATEVAEARAAVIALDSLERKSRLNMGRTLYDYKSCFRLHAKAGTEGGGWYAAQQVIAHHLRKNPKTIRNMIAGYKRIRNVPESIIAAADAQGIDLAAVRNLDLAEALLGGLVGRVGEPTPEEAAQTVLEVMALPESAPLSELTKEERTCHKGRVALRAATANLPVRDKLSYWVDIIEQEMWDVWGERQPVAITLIPKPGRLDIMGRRPLAGPELDKKVVA